MNGFKQGYIPKEALGFQETQSLNAFEAGQLVFMRNWPYADAILAGKDSKVAGKFGIAPLPGPDGHGASSLGGHSVAISQYSKHKATDIDFLKFLESDEIQRNDLTQGTLAPVITSLYSDPALVAKFPYLPTLLAEHPDRGAAPGDAVLPGRHRGDRDQRLRGTARAEVSTKDALSRSAVGDPVGHRWLVGSE